MKLPQQHKYHTQSRKSIRFIEGLLPDSWIIRQVNPDYGIDLEIEIWDEKPTGRIVYVQVKSLENYPKKDNGTYSIKRATLNYLNQRPNSFILFIIKDREIEILKVSELIDIYVNNFSKKPNSNYVSIPLVLDKQKLMKHHWIFYDYSRNWVRLTSILGWELYNSTIRGQIRYYPYISNFNQEPDFWRFEMYWIIGTLYREKRASKSVAKKLLENYNCETDFGKAGILGAISLLGFSSKVTQKYAKELVKSKEPIIFLVAIRNLLDKNNNENLELVQKLARYNDNIIENFEMKLQNGIEPTQPLESGYWYQQFYYAVKSSAAISLSNSRTNEGIRYFVHNFLQCAYTQILPSYTNNLWKNINEDSNYKNTVVNITKELVSMDFSDEKEVLNYLKKMSQLDE